MINLLVGLFTEWSGLEETSIMMKFQPPCHKGCQLLDQILDQVAQGSIQHGLKHIQVEGIHNL